MEKFVNHIQLGYLGLIPFLGCVGWPLMFGSNSVNLEFFSFYSIAILAFMAGNLWHAGQQSFADAIKAVLPVIPIPFLSFLPIEPSSFSFISGSLDGNSFCNKNQATVSCISTNGRPIVIQDTMPSTTSANTQ